jgi:hypothetical protein
MLHSQAGGDTVRVSDIGRRCRQQRVVARRHSMRLHARYLLAIASGLAMEHSAVSRTQVGRWASASLYMLTPTTRNIACNISLRYTASYLAVLCECQDNKTS